MLGKTVALVIALVACSFAQAPGRISTMTRPMAIFSEMESRLDDALQKKDSKALGQFLSDEFQVWTPAGNGDPIPREDWLKKQARCTARPAQVRNMAVREVGDANIVSFVEVRDSTCGANTTRGAQFIVDVWQKKGDSWQLTDRYASPTKAPAGPRRPTGKE